MDNEGQVTSSAHTQVQGLPAQSRKLRLQVHHTEFARASGAAATGRVVTRAQAQVSCRLPPAESGTGESRLEVWTVSWSWGADGGSARQKEISSLLYELHISVNFGYLVKFVLITIE